MWLNAVLVNPGSPKIATACIAHIYSFVARSEELLFHSNGHKAKQPPGQTTGRTNDNSAKRDSATQNLCQFTIRVNEIFSNIQYSAYPHSSFLPVQMKTKWTAVLECSIMYLHAFYMSLQMQTWKQTVSQLGRDKPNLI